jgi:methyl-accepting chemotaxis protein
MSTSVAPSSPASTAPGPLKYKRRMRNYIINARFQLKYTAMIVGVTLVISAFLGAFLWRTSGEVMFESQKVVEESRKVSEVARLNILKDPIYAENPELLQAVTEGSTDQDKQVERQQAQLIAQQRTMLYSLVGALSVLVVLIGLLGIYFTHKVAGPIHMMKILLKQVGDGKLNYQRRLRKGDELQDFFEAFQKMVDQLKARQAKEVQQLEEALEEARKGGASEDALKNLVSVREEMKRALET